MMKSTKIKRLSLNKKTIANLDTIEMRNIFAGQEDEQQAVELSDTCPQNCVISTYTYYTCQPWSCAPYICPVTVKDVTV